jgi:glycosyltransferase involved in cell wall biosynthesis
MGLVYRLAPPKLDSASLEALIEIVRRRPQTRVLVPGGGPSLPVLVDLAERAGVRANFHFMGWLPHRELPAFYDRLDLYVAPVAEESFGVVVPYAMFMAVPVVACRTGALPEILGDDRWLCSGREELVAKAAAVLDAPGEWRAAAARLRPAAARFELATMLEAYDGLYQGFLK